MHAIGSHDYLDGSCGAGAHTAAFMQGYNDGYSGSRLAQNTQHTTLSGGRDNRLLCYAAGGLLLLGGVPAPQVFAAGAVAHNAGLCP